MERKTLKKRITTLYTSSFIGNKTVSKVIQDLEMLFKAHSEYSDLNFKVGYSSQLELYGIRLENDEEYNKRIYASELKKQRAEERLRKAEEKKKAAEEKKREERRILYHKLRQEFESEILL